MSSSRRRSGFHRAGALLRLLILILFALLVYLFWRDIAQIILKTTGFGAVLLVGWFAALAWAGFSQHFRLARQRWNRWLGAMVLTAFAWGVLTLFRPETYLLDVHLKEFTLGGSWGQSLLGPSYAWARLAALGIGGFAISSPRSSLKLIGWLSLSLWQFFTLLVEQLWKALTFLASYGFKGLVSLLRSAGRGLANLMSRKPMPAEAGQRPRKPKKARPPAEETMPESVTPVSDEKVAPIEPSTDLPPIEFLNKAPKAAFAQADETERAKLLEEALASYGVEARVVQVNPGPSVTQFGVEPGWERKFRRVLERDADGRIKKDKDGNPLYRLEEVSRTRVKVERFLSLANDLALTLAVPSVRIEAPVPGKPLVGIEVPNVSTAIVPLRSVIESPAFQKARAKSKLVVALGQAAGGEPVVCDLAKMPHLLIAGATGSGKTVCLNCMITSFLMKTTPSEVRLVLIDPKRVEMVTFSGIPHLLTPVVVDIDKAIEALRRVTVEMDHRYRRFAAAGTRNIDTYNKKAAEPLPYIVVFIDELADLMMSAADVVEPLICRLAQLSRATGIHLVVATQRPSVDVVTGLIKANFPARISFAVVSVVDSRTILDAPGAEKLLGQGDMLYLPPDAHKPRRLRGCFVSDEEMDKVTNFWRKWAQEHLPPEQDRIAQEFSSLPVEKIELDPFLERARELARENPRLSISLLQRRLHIGYPRAARLMEQLEDEGLVTRGAEELGEE